MSLRLGLIGHPVSHSLSPPMHKAALSFFGLAGSYELLDLDCSGAELKAAILALPEQGFSGFNITIPHKQVAFEIIESSPEAAMLEAANTVRIDSSGEMFAHNTDFPGVRLALEAVLKEQNVISSGLSSGKLKPIVLGFGGAARACIAALLDLGAQSVLIGVRDPAKVEASSKALESRISSYLQRSCQIELSTFEELRTRDLSLLMNCTPIGLSAEEPLPSWISQVFCRENAEQIFFFDTVYKRDRSATLLMQYAQKQGIACCDGLMMLVEQAALAFEFWTQRQIHSKHMLQALEY